MRFYRLVKPKWAQKTLANDEPNPEFLQEIDGPNVFEGCDFTQEFIQEKNQQGYHVYFFPNHPTRDVYAEGTKFLNGKLIDKFNYVFVDMDLKDKTYASKENFYETLKKFPIKPTMTVDSGNGVHAYWQVDGLTRDAYVITQMALLNHFKTDESVWTVLQLMRFPGSFNTKQKDAPIPVQVVPECSSGEIYTINMFPPEIYNLDQKIAQKAQTHIDRLDGKSDLNFAEDVNLDELPERFLKLMADKNTIRQMFENPKSFGDRSSTDMKLANILFSEKFDVKQALAILSNTQKALEKGPHRREYAELTVSKVYGDRPKNKFMSAGEYLRGDHTTVAEPPINGPYYLDYGVLGEPWRRKEILGVIAGAGVGKTAFALNIIKDTIENNPNNDDVFVFFSLEMSKKQIIKRWVSLVGNRPELNDRLFVVDTQDENGMPINIGLQEIYEFCSEIKQCTGKHIGALVIDHFHIISTHIDIRKSPNFGIMSEQNTGYGDVRNLSLNGLATQLKSLTKTLDTFTILLSQTTKEKGVGDLPLGKDAAYGVSQYEWIVDRIVTIWQPLMRVRSKTSLNILAFQYAKIREKHPNDKIQEHSPKLLTYDLDSGKLRVTTSEEFEEFNRMYPLASQAREDAIKQRPQEYSTQINLREITQILQKNGVYSERKV